jgi:hypothetical protein
MRNPEPTEPDRANEVRLCIMAGEMDRDVESPKTEPKEEIP